MNLSTRSKRRSFQAGFILFLKLLILVCLVKLLFILFNSSLTKEYSSPRWLMIAGWSLFYDELIILLLLLPVLVFPVVARHSVSRLTYASILSFMVLLNMADVFYFRYQHQRANADMIYVLSGLEGFGNHLLLLLLVIISVAATIWIINKWLFVFSAVAERNLMVLAFPLLLLLLPKGMLLPSYPLTTLRSNELMFAQNSFHTFTYSVFRKEESTLHPFRFMDKSEAGALFHNRTRVESAGNKRNVMLFIMESVPADFFIEGPYKTPLPFFDSLIAKSTWYQNAYSYSHNSNKGITAILSGLPTLTDIPLYHSGYASLSKTNIGDILNEGGYETSFFIGDSYDGFGFAKFCNWTGINYFSREDMPVGRNIDRHTLGLHDAEVASFAVKKLKAGQKPFFSVFYNLSTHFPNDLPDNFKPDPSLTMPMNAMRYYDRVLGNFFRSIENESWFSNTVFIFCSDHWMYPDHRNDAVDPVSSFRIPVFVFDPRKPFPVKEQKTVSQLDIMPTILSYTGFDSTVISYGVQLNEQDSGRIVFARENNVLYQAFNENYMLGYNVVNNKTEYLYRIDDDQRINIAGKNREAETRLVKALQAFLQVAADHYRGKVN